MKKKLLTAIMTVAFLAASFAPVMSVNAAGSPSSSSSSSSDDDDDDDDDDKDEEQTTTATPAASTPASTPATTPAATPTEQTPSNSIVTDVPTTDQEILAKSQGIASESTDYELSAVDPSVLSSDEVAKDTNTVAQSVADYYSDGTGVIVVANVEYVIDIDETETAEKDSEGNYTVTLTAPNLTVAENEQLYVIHYKSDGTKEVIPASLANGRLVFKVKDFSPFVVIKLTLLSGQAGTTDPGATETPAAGPVVAPKTGETAPYAMIAVTLLAAAGAVISGKKYFNAK